MKSLRIWIGLGVGLLAFMASLRPALAQNLRYDNHREVRIPEYATFRLGPFHSSWAFTASTGYRYVRTSGAGSDYLFSGSRGRLKKDGGDFPLILGLDTRNYLVIGPHTDLDVSLGFRYEYFPRDTQESEFRIFVPGEGLNANLSMETAPLPYLRMRFWDAFGWRMDYLDTRGLEDRYGGQRFENIVNTVGVDGDFLVAERQNVGFGLSRGDRWAMDDEWEDQSRVTHHGHLLYEYELAEYMIVGLQAALEHNDYPESDRPSSLIKSYRVNLNTRVTERTTMAGFVGYSMGTVSGTNAAQEINTTLYGGRIETHLRPDLSHGLTYAHGIQGGYRWALEEFDILRYDLRWVGDFYKWNIYTGFQVLDPASPTVNGYTDWTSGIVGEVPIIPAVSLVGSVRYSQRTNEDENLVTLNDPELRSDYNTWAYRVGPVLRLTEGFKLEAYAEHIKRDGDDSDLDYTRDIISVLLTYRHEL